MDAGLMASAQSHRTRLDRSYRLIYTAIARLAQAQDQRAGRASLRQADGLGRARRAGRASLRLWAAACRLRGGSSGSSGGEQRAWPVLALAEDQFAQHTNSARAASEGPDRAVGMWPWVLK